MTPYQKLAAVKEAFQQGRPIILVDSEDRENEGDLIFPAEKITPGIMNFIIRNTSGIVCLSLSQTYVQRLQLTPMVAHNSSRYGTPFTVSIEAKKGVTTGVSAADRATTVLTAVADHAKPDDLAKPGHIFPLAAHPEGLLGRTGHTEGAIDLMRLCGYRPAAVLCEVMNPEGTMMRRPQLEIFGREHQLPLLSLEEVLHLLKSPAHH